MVVPVDKQVAGGRRGVPDVGEAGGQRGQAETEPAWRAVGGDDLRFGQLGDDRLSVRMPEGEVAAAPGRVTGGRELAAERFQPLGGQLGQVTGEPDALVADPVDACLYQQASAFLDSSRTGDIRRARHELDDPLRGPVFRDHYKLVALGEPAPHRLSENVAQSRRYVQER